MLGTLASGWTHRPNGSAADVARAADAGIAPIVNDMYRESQFSAGSTGGATELGTPGPPPIPAMEPPVITARSQRPV